MGPLLQLLTESSGLPEQIAAAVRQSNPALFNSHSSSKQCQCCKHCRTVSPAPFAADPNPKPSACSGPVVAAACCLPTGCGLPGWPRCAGRCRQGRARQVIYGGTHVRAVGCCCWRGESEWSSAGSSAPTWACGCSVRACSHPSINTSNENLEQELLLNILVVV